jgi:hypothetical protein
MLRLVEPNDLTTRILEDIRDEIRAMRTEQRDTNKAVQALAEVQQTFAEHATARFEVIETSLRDLAQQLVILGRGVKVAIEHRASFDARLESHEERITDLERRLAEHP